MAFLETSNSTEHLMVDDELYPVLSNFRWSLNREGYGQTCLYSKTVAIHRFICGVMEGNRHIVVDHIDGNPLNNKRSNLRVCSQTENQWNRKPTITNYTGFKGVTRYKGKFKATIYINGINRHLGYFEESEDAALAYDKAARELHGEFARLNFPDEVSA